MILEILIDYDILAHQLRFASSILGIAMLQVLHETGFGSRLVFSLNFDAIVKTATSPPSLANVIFSNFGKHSGAPCNLLIEAA